jgi:hypothetical protein
MLLAAAQQSVAKKHARVGIAVREPRWFAAAVGLAAAGACY